MIELDGFARNSLTRAKFSVQFKTRKIYIIIFFFDEKKKIQKSQLFACERKLCCAKGEREARSKERKVKSRENNFCDFFDLFLFAKLHKIKRDIDGE